MKRRVTKPEVLISSTQGSVRVPRKKITQLVAFAARAEGVRVAEVDIAVVTARRIASINRKYLGVSGATDVLSFDLSSADSDGISAQIIACGDVAAKQARSRGIGVQRELMLYILHGLLHLMGYDDATAGEAARMHAREEQLLNEFAIFYRGKCR